MNKPKSDVARLENDNKDEHKIIEKQIDGDIVNVDISMYEENNMEECDGGDLSSKTTG